MDVKVRLLAWLSRRLAGNDPESLWIYRQGVAVQDPDDWLSPLVEQTADGFREHAPQLVAARYRAFRSVVTIDETKEELGR